MIGRAAFPVEADPLTRTAALKARPDLDLLSCRDFETAVRAVQTGDAEVCVFPDQSSVNGRVQDTYHLLPGCDLHIVREIFLRPPGDAKNCESVTRFLVLAPDPVRRNDAERTMKTTLVFDLENVAGALRGALGAFAAEDLNLTRIESYTLGGRLHAARFLVDVDGAATEPAFARALKKLAKACGDVRVLGTYPNEQKTCPTP